MLFESYVWREELQAIIERLEIQNLPLSDVQSYNIQKDLSIAFFVIRRLVELHKQGHRTVEFKFKVDAFQSKKNTSFLNSHHVDKLFDLENAISMVKGQNFISNSFIHAMTLSIDEALSYIFIHSDYDKNKYIYKIPYDNIMKFLKLAVQDSAASQHYHRDPETNKEVLKNYSDVLKPPAN